MQEMGSRYLFIVLYALLERYLSRGDYRLARGGAQRQTSSAPRSRARPRHLIVTGPARRPKPGEPVVAVLGGLMVIAAVALYRKGLGTTFYYDEWNFVIDRRGWISTRS